MALVVTARHSGNGGQSAAQTLTTDSATESANSHLLVGSAAQNDVHTAAQDGQSLSGGGLSYTQVTQTDVVAWDGSASFRMRGAVHSAPVGGSPSAHTITIDHYIEGAGGDEGFYCAVAVDVTGHDADDPIAQSATNGSSLGAGDSEQGTVTLAATPTEDNLVVVWFFAGADGGGGFAAPTIGGQSMTERFNQNDNWTQAGCWSRVIDGTESNNVITCTDLGQSVGQYTAVAVEIAADAGGGATVNGTADISLGALTLAAAGRRVVHGTASVTLGALTLSATGRRTVRGSADVTLGALTLTATGRRTVYGSASVPLGGLTLTGSGHRTVHGLASVPLDGIDVTLTGHRVVYGTADISLGGLELAALGQVVGVVHGAADVTLGSLALSATGKRVVHGTADLQLGGLNLTGTGQDITHGTAQVSLGALDVTATGHRVVHGTATITFGGLTLTATAAGLAVDPVVLPPYREPAVPDYQEAAVPAYRERAVPAYQEAL